MSIAGLHLLACATCRVDADTPVFLAEQTMLKFLLTLTMLMLAGLGIIIYRFAKAARSARATA